MEKPNLAISFSGGRSSAVMTKICLDMYEDTHNISITFCNTGCEHPATLDFVNDCDTHWGLKVVWLEACIDGRRGVGVRHKIVDYTSASRDGEPFEAFIKKYGIPNQTSPICTSRLKEDVMVSYRKSIGWVLGKNRNYQTAIGIRADEIDRISVRSEELGLIYPLVNLNITKSQVNKYMSQFDWDLKIPNDAYGNCVWCWKKSFRKLATVAKENPGFFDFPKRMEIEYGNHLTKYPGQSFRATVGPDGKRHFFRRHKDTNYIFDMARNMKPCDVYSEDAIQMGLFDDLDLGGSCDQGCEVWT